MKKLYVIVLFTLIAFPINFGQKSKSAKARPVKPKATPSKQIDNNPTWQTFSSPENDFSVLLPNKPRVIKGNIPNTNLKTTSWLSGDQGVDYLVGRIQTTTTVAMLNDEGARITLDASESSITGAGVEVLEKKVIYEGGPGLYYVKRHPTGEIQFVWAILVRERRQIYHINAIIKNDSAIARENVEKFITSFKFR